MANHNISTINKMNHVVNKRPWGFENQVALITGSANGVGRDLVLEFARAGAYVIATDIDIDALEQTKEIANKHNLNSVETKKLDVRVQSDFRQVLEYVKNKFKTVHVLINNAGKAKRTDLEAIEPDEFDDIININLRSVFLGCQTFIPIMKKNGYGRIVNITSLAGYNGGTIASAHYSAAKGGAIALTKYFARYVGDSGVTVAGIAPGPIETARMRVDSETAKNMIKQIPLKRFMYTSEIVAAVQFLSSNESAFCNGAILDMNGGLYLR